jgi:hypothetical protein
MPVPVHKLSSVLEQQLAPRLSTSLADRLICGAIDISQHVLDRKDRQGSNKRTRSSITVTLGHLKDYEERGGKL